MKIFITTIVLVLTAFSAKSQNNLAGVYQLIQKDIDSIIAGETITLKCDSTFVIGSDTFKWKSVGKWNMKKDVAIFFSDTIYRRGQLLIQKNKWRYYIQNNALVDVTKVETERQYKRRVRKTNKMLQHASSVEDYTVYKQRQENLIYKKVQSVICK